MKTMLDRRIKTLLILGLATVMILQTCVISYGAGDPYALVTQQDIEDARSLLEAMGQPAVNSKGQPLNIKTYVIYKVVAFGNPHGDTKTDGDGMIQYRYLGYDIAGNDITNDLFPPDQSGTIPLQEKLWVAGDTNYATWGLVLQHPGLKEHVLSVDVLNDGCQTDLSLTEILSARPVRDWSEKLDYIRIMSVPSVEMNGTAQLRQANGFYDTFTIPALKSTIQTHVTISSDKETYEMDPAMDHIDVPVAVSADVDHGALPAGCVTATKVKYLGYMAPSGGRTAEEASVENPESFIARIYKTDLNEGYNAVTLQGEGEFHSVFPRDPDPIVKTASKRITVLLASPGNPVPDPETPPEPEDEPKDISAQADLVLPSYSFEGHPVVAKDCSVFEVDGAVRPAANVYADGLARNRFYAADRSVAVRKTGVVEAEMIFPKPGPYIAGLEIKPDGGTASTDEERIEIRSTPDIESRVGGVQKENRKQILDIKVAVNPAYPLSDFSLELWQEGRAEEKIRLDEDHPQQNSGIIRTRPLKKAIDGGSADGFAVYSLEFLAKEPGEIGCRIFAEDSRGRSDEEVLAICVAPDLAPDAAIALPVKHIRNEKSASAEIIAEDVTVSTDGDQLVRRWEILGHDGEAISPELTDLSFGTRKKVKFGIEGVGPFQVRLYLKERWIEPTLEEYVTDDDRKTAEIQAFSEIDNIAPVVSLSPLETVKAKLLLLAGGDEELSRIGNADVYRQEFIRNGIDARIHAEKLPAIAAASGAGSAPGTILAVDSAFGYEGRWTFLEEEAYAIDDDRLYVLEAAWPRGGSGDLPQAPYRLKAYNIKDSCSQTIARPGIEAEPEWICAIDPARMAISHDSEVSIGQDDTGEHLYLNCDARTMIIHKKTGSLMACLPIETGSLNYDTEGYVHILKYDGIYVLDKQNCLARKVFSAPVGTRISEISRRIGGKVHFAATGTGKLLRGIYDPESGKTALKIIELPSDGPASAIYDIAGIDAAGNMIVSFEGKSGSGYENGFQVYSRSNRPVMANHRAFSEDGQCLCTPICDENGICTNVAMSWQRKSGTERLFEVLLCGSSGSIGEVFAMRSDSGYPCKNENILAKKCGNTIYLAYGGIWDYIFGTGYDYRERAVTLTADAATGRVTQKNSGTFGVQASDEYGRQGDLHAAIQSSGNSVSAPSSRTKVLAWPQSPWNLIGRLIDKYVENDGDPNYVVISDTEGKISGSDPEADAVLAKAAGAGAYLMIDRDADPVRIRDRIIEERCGLTSVLFVRGNGNGAEINKRLRMKTGREYHIDYDVRIPEEAVEKAGDSAEALIGDMLRLDFDLAHILPGGQFEDGGYIVTGMQKEDFDDAELNGFFTQADVSKAADGVYKACDAGQGDSDMNRLRTYKDTVKFTIPEGKKAVLTFDCRYDIYRAFIKGNDVMIDGKPWNADISASRTGEGHYVHRELLEAGEHIVEFNLAFYGGLPASYKFHIDDLTVLYVEKMDGTEAAEISGNTDNLPIKPEISIEPGADGWRHVSATVISPPDVAVFRPQQCERYYEDFNDIALIPYLKAVSSPDRDGFRIMNGQYTHDYGSACSGALEFHLPAGSAARASVDTWSIIGRASAIYRMGESTWENGQRNSVADEYKYTGSPCAISTPAFRGDGAMTVRIGYRDRTGVTGLALCVFEDNALTMAGRYFNDEDPDRIYLESDTISGAGTVRFVFPEAGTEAGEAADGCEIQNIRIYSIENGVRNYLVDDRFSSGSGTGDWNVASGEASVRQTETGSAPEMASIVYGKGDLVSYNIGYYDYENDPSKRQYWRYRHEAFSDGPHPDAGRILDKPIERFYVDGRYTVEHWQEDTTGSADYDKLSNIEEMTFYIEGSGEAPWIRSIRTVPQTIRENGKYRLMVCVDDTEKDILALKTEIFDKNGKLIHAFENSGIQPEGGVYPPVLTEYADAGKAGKYRVVCTVRDEDGAGLGTGSFIVVTDSSLKGAVRHTDQWDLNRRRYNIAKFGKEENASSPEYGLEPRGRLVFWPGEKLVLRAVTSSDAVSVSARILNEAGYSADLKKTSASGNGGTSAPGDPGTAEWSGSIWDENMIGKWGKEAPKELAIRFTSVFRAADAGDGTGETIKTEDVKIILYAPSDFWQLHRVW